MNRHIPTGTRGDYTYAQVKLMNTFRKLWEQHVMWTRSFIISTAADLGDLEFVTTRLLRNPMDFANQLRIFYGSKIANRFEELFSEHLLIAAKLVNDAKMGNTTAAAEDRAQWFANADKIATFLASINPNWSQSEWTAMLYDHLKMTEQEATLRLNGRYSEDIQLYDSIEEQALMMADMMSQGVIKQFRV